MDGILLESVSKIFRQRSLFNFLRRNPCGRNANKSSQKRALSDVSFSVPSGGVLALLGPNGSGKTTTLKLLSTILLPDEGRVLVEGWDTRTQAAEVRKRVAIAFASERSFFPRLTARENLDFFAALDDVPRKLRKQRIENILERCGLVEAGDELVMKFSSGMSQRLALARALVKEPSVILFDEPTRSLDADGTTRLWNLIRELPLSGATVIIATHNFEEAVAIADSVAILQRGELMACRSTARIKNAGANGATITAGATSPMAAGISKDELRSFYFRVTAEPAGATELIEAVS